VPSWLNLLFYVIAVGVITWVFFIIDRLGQALTKLDALSSHLESTLQTNPFLRRRAER
jgi:hypothetical protein